ncbi:MAG: acetylxylan esterase [Provencibacterium sp.]|jgi:cephalosporin-C deacetylase|nr:acetylxylan esterase [Provencibacterium sp.]
MEYLDKKIEELSAYLPPLTRREDFGAFWQESIAQARAAALQPDVKRRAYPSRYVEVYDVSYRGFDETRIHGLFIRPLFAGEEKLPCLIHFHGFSGSRGAPSDFMHWVLLGMAVLSVDCREQGGITGNCAHYSDSGMVSNVTSKGLLHKEEYYYRAVYIDCLKALDMAEALPQVDPRRLAVRGVSQGGALGMAVCSLDRRPALLMANVPSGSELQARVEGRHGSFSSVNDYLRRYPDRVDTVYETLSYFDTMNMAENIRCPVLASVALADQVCPARCYFASYNRIKSPKHICVYPFNEHDGAGQVHLEKELQFLKDSGLLNG